MQEMITQKTSLNLDGNQHSNNKQRSQSAIGLLIDNSDFRIKNQQKLRWQEVLGLFPMIETKPSQ